MPHKILVCDYRDPSWDYYGLITKSNPLFPKNAAFKKFCFDRNNSFIRQVNVLQDHLVTSIEASKRKYYCTMTNELINTQKSPKAFWSVLKGFLN